VLNPLKNGGNADMSGISQLPEGCFTEANNIQVIMLFPANYFRVLMNGKATILTPAFSGGTTTKYATPVSQILAIVSNQLGISPSEINIQLYNPDKDNAGNFGSANGKAMLTYNPNVFSEAVSTRAAYQVWAGYLIINGATVSPNSQINSPFMSDFWTPDLNEKRDAGSYMDYFNLTGWA
jgi:hypothetical protein